VRIAHVTFSFWPVRGGADAYLADLAEAFCIAGHEQTVFQASSPQPLAEADVAERKRWEADHRLSVVEWPVPTHLSPGRRFWLTTARVAQSRPLLRTFDRVIAHYPNYALPLLGHPGLIGLSHGVTWDCPASGSPAFRGRSGASNAFKKGIAAAAFRSARRFVANDTFFLREMGLRIAPGERLWEEAAPGRWCLPNATDLSRFQPDPHVKVEPVLLMARNFYRNRGIRLGIEAFALLARETPGYRLRIVGDAGDAGYREECRNLAESLGVASQTEFAGPVSWRDMPLEYRKAAVSLVPSLCGEGTSLSALESMACGTPVAASRAGGLPDLPCVHAASTPSALARALSQILADREGYSRRQREAVQAGFSRERWASAWRRVVES
jgi:glycosyltransferase involved in cell wall biosynthesis